MMCNLVDEYLDCTGSGTYAEPDTSMDTECEIKKKY